MTSTPTHALTWFEIPVRDLDRAQRFYEQVLQRPLAREAMGPRITLAGFPYAQGQGAGGCLKASADGAPAGHGTIVYLDAGPMLDAAAARVADAGGRVVQPVHAIGPHGCRAVIVDSEGNRLALHSTGAP